MKKFFKKIADFIKEAAWIQPILFVGIIMILILGIQGVGKAVNKAQNADWSCGCKETKADPYTKILAEDVLEKINNGDNFVLYIGYESCSGCQAFLPVLERYHREYPKQKIYYLSIETNDEGEYKDATLTKDLLDSIYAPIKKALGDELGTPTVAAFKGGKCLDAKVGGGANGISVTDLVDLQELVKEEE